VSDSTQHEKANHLLTDWKTKTFGEIESMNMELAS
jgi:hypothetical protein